jgi:hypothetical protein
MVELLHSRDASVLATTRRKVWTPVSLCAQQALISSKHDLSLVHFDCNVRKDEDEPSRTVLFGRT